MRHSVTSVDPDERTGQCSVCGPVKVYANSSYKGQRRWRCAARSLGRLEANMATILLDLAYLRCAQPILARIRGER